MQHSNTEHAITNALYRTNASYYAEKKCWEVALSTPKGDIVHSFQTKPHWLDSIEQINAIIKKHPDPQKLRDLTDTIESMSKNSFDIQRKQFKNDQLTTFVERIPRLEDIDCLEKIFTIKRRDEERSCAHHGSMASSHCSTLWRLARVVDTLKDRKRTLRPFCFFRVPQKQDRPL